MIYNIPKTKSGAPKKIRRNLGILTFDSFVEKTYIEFVNGMSTKDILLKYSIARRQEREYETRLVNHFLLNRKNESVDVLCKFAELQISKSIDLGFLYIIQIDNRIKFGKTKNLNKRLNSYKTGSGTTPKLLSYWFGVGYSSIEKTLKKDLSGLGITLEWFDEQHLEKIQEAFNKTVYIS